jgi:hypothetical protein
MYDIKYIQIIILIQHSSKVLMIMNMKMMDGALLLSTSFYEEF